MTSDVPRFAEGRERCPHARTAAHAPSSRSHEPLAHRPTTRPSLGPRTRADQAPRVIRGGATRFGGGVLEEVSRSGKPGESQESTGTGVFASRFCAARRVSPLPQGRPREASEKEGRHGARPCEDRKSSGSCPHVVLQLQKSTGDTLVSKKLVKRAPKRAAGASERGPRSPRPTTVTRGGCADGRRRNVATPDRSGPQGARSGEGPG
jgi:hypothetical protein